MIQRATHTTTNATSLFTRGEKKREKLCNFPRTYLSFFGGNLHSTLHYNYNYNYSPIGFLIRDYISLSLNEWDFALLGRESK